MIISVSFLCNSQLFLNSFFVNYIYIMVINKQTCKYEYNFTIGKVRYCVNWLRYLLKMSEQIMPPGSFYRKLWIIPQRCKKNGVLQTKPQKQCMLEIFLLEYNKKAYDTKIAAIIEKINRRRKFHTNNDSTLQDII